MIKIATAAPAFAAEAICVALIMMLALFWILFAALAFAADAICVACAAKNGIGAEQRSDT